MLGENLSITILGSAVQAATISSDTQPNYRCRGVDVVVDVTVAPGVQTVTPSIEGYDPTSGKWYTILTGTAISAVSTVVLSVFPGATAAANTVVNAQLPRGWRVTMTHSGAGNFTYSVGANLNG